MKTIEVTQRLFAGFIDSSIEIFAKGRNLFFVQNGNTQDISQLPKDVHNIIEKHMWANKAAVKILYSWCENVPDMIEQYMFCNFGGLTIEPDFDNNTKKLTSESWECPVRATCEGRGIVCSCSNDSKFTRKEIEVLSYVEKNPAQPFKQVAANLHMAQNTLLQHTQSIYRKANIHSKPELILKAMSLNSL
jgi:DNA-binding CsgD family transcriptional regulator